jgi:hypothetical protein
MFVIFYCTGAWNEMPLELISLLEILWEYFNFMYMNFQSSRGPFEFLLYISLDPFHVLLYPDHKSDNINWKITVLFTIVWHSHYIHVKHTTMSSFMLFAIVQDEILE